MTTSDSHKVTTWTTGEIVSDDAWVDDFRHALIEWLGGYFSAEDRVRLDYTVAGELDLSGDPPDTRPQTVHIMFEYHED